MSAKIFDTIDLDNLKLAVPKTSRASSGCKTSIIQTRTGERLNIQTPVMTIPWNIVMKKMDENSNVQCQLALSFVTADENEDVAKFKRFLDDFDVRIKQLASAVPDLGKKADAKHIDGVFKDTVKESEKYPSTFQPKIWLSCKSPGSNDVDDFTMDLTVFDLEGAKIDGSCLTKGTPAAAIVQPSYVWCSALGVGITWTVKQVVCRPAIPGDQFSFDMSASGFGEPPSKRSRTDEDAYDF